MTAETLLWSLAQWTVRAVLLAGAAALLLAVWRVRDVSLRLAAWTTVLAGVLLLPIGGALAPPVTFVASRLPPLLQASPTVPVNAPNLPVPTPAPEPRWPLWIAGLWLVVSAILLLRLFAGIWLVRRLLRASLPIEPGVRESADISVPVTLGMLRPVIMLPPDWRAWDPMQLQAVLAHERAHARRRDPLRQAAAALYRSLCWFHPLAWWLAAHLAQLAEAASDDAALAEVRDEHAYAAILLSFFERAPRRVAWHGVAMAARGSATRRIERILDRRRSLSGPLAKPVYAALVLAALPLVYLAAAAQPSAAGHDDRVAYADQHYAASGIAGSRTDRGRTYIEFGPPDQIESTPGVQGRPYAEETWTYRHIEGRGDNVAFHFVDAWLQGNYRLLASQNLLPEPPVLALAQRPQAPAENSVRVLVRTGASNRLVNIYGRLTVADTHKVKWVFEETTRDTALLIPVMLPAGSYRLQVFFARDGRRNSRELSFRVVDGEALQVSVESGIPVDDPRTRQ